MSNTPPRSSLSSPTLPPSSPAAAAAPSESNADRIARFEEMVKLVRTIETGLRHLQNDVAEERRDIASLLQRTERLREDLPPDYTLWLTSIDEALKQDRGDVDVLMGQLDQQRQGPGLATRFNAAVETVEKRLIAGIETREKASRQRLADAEQQLKDANERLTAARESERRVSGKRSLFWSERVGLVVAGMVVAGGIVAGLVTQWPVWSGSQALRLDPAAFDRLLYCQGKAQGTPAGVICGDMEVKPF